MFGKKTKGKPCSCPPGKHCTACFNRKNPQINGAESSIYSSIHSPLYRYRRSKTLKNEDYSNLTPTSKETSRRTPICQWYSRRKARRELKADQKKTRKLFEQKLQSEREQELIKQYEKQYEELDKYHIEPTPSTPTYSYKASKKPTMYEQIESYYDEPVTTSGTKVKKRYKPKIKATNTRGKNIITEETYCENLRTRFSNWCYRFCCQFFCCLSCLLIMAYVVIIIT